MLYMVYVKLILLAYVESFLLGPPSLLRVDDRDALESIIFVADWNRFMLVAAESFIVNTMGLCCLNYG